MEDDGFKNLIDDEDEKIEELIEAAYARGFADDFVLSVSKQFKLNGNLSEAQKQGLRNIVNAQSGYDFDSDDDGDECDYDGDECDYGRYDPDFLF